MAGRPPRAYTPVAMKQPRSTFRAVCASAIVAGLTALCAPAQGATPLVPPSEIPPSPTPPPVDPLQPPMENPALANTDANLAPKGETERFISRISMLNAEQSRVSTIAAQRAANEQVRTFASQISATSQTVEQDIDQAARARNVLVPTGRQANELSDDSDKLQSKDGKDFDEDFVHRIVKIQKDAVETLEDYSKDNDSDPELVAFAQKHLPAMRENLRQAQSLEKTVD
jgi:putative membrane protein